MMETRVYYGEYSLKHWLVLILKRNIVLPNYQRSFVWDKRDVIRLMKSFKEGQFVQPVTIANYVGDSRSTNLLLDGQQRLTSILLAYLGYMPNKLKFDDFQVCATGDDSADDNIEEKLRDDKKIIGWTFENLLDKQICNNKIEVLKNRLKNDSNYESLNFPFIENPDVFFENKFLGFSYIIPNLKNNELSQKYFSTLFRNMNYLGKKLSPLESRRSLYYLNSDLERYFDGLTEDNKDVLNGIGIIENMQYRKIDFVRYLSILSQYFSEGGNSKKVMVGYSAYSLRENYYADYVSYIVDLEQDDRITKFDKFHFEKSFPNDVWKTRFEKLRVKIASLRPQLGLNDRKNAFTSWIDADYWLFGLIYYILFEGKDINLNHNLISSISAEITLKRDDLPYCKNTNRLNNLRDRVESSIKIYSFYVHD